MIIDRLSTDDDFYKQAIDLRYELFFKKLKLPFSIVQDDLESVSEHFGMRKGNTLYAYGRLTKLDSREYKISQVAVCPSFQRKGYGKELLSNIIEFAKNADAKLIELNSQVSVVGLYRGFGFIETGNTYPSKTTGVSHVKMVLHPVT